MPNALPPIPIRTKVLDDQGMITQPWFNFLRELYNRVGGASANSNTALQTSIATLEAEVSVLSGQVDDIDQGRAL